MLKYSGSPTSKTRLRKLFISNLTSIPAEILIMSSENDNVESGSSKPKMSLESLSKEDLISMLQKIRAHAQQIQAEKKIAEELYSTTTKEKDELKVKAIGVLKRCKELEEQCRKQSEALAGKSGVDGKHFAIALYCNYN